jgi:hypothetical protein
MNKKFNEKVQKEKETEDQIEVCENHRKSISINKNDVTKSDMNSQQLSTQIKEISLLIQFQI